MTNVKYTAEQLRNMSLEESEKIFRSMSIVTPTLEQLKAFDVGIYDEDGNLIGDKEGDDY